MPMMNVSESMFLLLAQAAAQPRSGSGTVPSNQVLLYVGLLLLVLLAGAVTVFLLRRKLLGSESSVDTTTGLMESMRQLRDSGQMTQAEYDAARKTMAQRVSRSMNRKAESQAAPKMDNSPGT